MKDVRAADRELVFDKMEQADSTLIEIYEIVEMWEGNAKAWQPDEWRKAQNIKEQIWEDGKRMWHSNPPWNEG